ncbi:MAG: alpha/beta fold hydrolase [Chloroflexi bacterium]|nr:alpha/beta fold hydrolase [Chloroflexota bacterium]
MTSRLIDGENRIKVNGVTHWYQIAGVERAAVEGRATTPLVIVHGGPGGHVYNFERTIGSQLEAFTTVIYYEQRGCGRSDQPPDPYTYTLEMLVSDLDELRQALGHDQLNLLGFSFGGELALEYALAHPEHVERLIIQSPTLGRRIGAPGLFDERTACVQLYGFQLVAYGEVARVVGDILNTNDSLTARLDQVWQNVDTETVDRFLFHNHAAAKLNRRLWSESGLINTGYMLAALTQQTADTPLLDRIAVLSVPALVVVGLYDRNTGVEACRDAATRLPTARLMVFEHSAHFPEMEEPDRYAATIREFLADEVVSG